MAVSGRLVGVVLKCTVVILQSIVITVIFCWIINTYYACRNMNFCSQIHFEIAFSLFWFCFVFSFLNAYEFFKKWSWRAELMVLCETPWSHPVTEGRQAVERHSSSLVIPCLSQASLKSGLRNADRIMSGKKGLISGLFFMSWDKERKQWGYESVHGSVRYTLL